MLKLPKMQHDKENELKEYQPFLPGWGPGILTDQAIPKLLDGLQLQLSSLDACEDIVDRLIAATQQDLPVDVDALADYCGVVSIDEQVNFQHGGLIRQIQGQDGLYDVIIDQNKGEREKRSILAHEIGHVLLKVLGYRDTLGYKFSDKEAHDFCYLLEAVLLAPRSLLKPRVSALIQPDDNIRWNVWAKDPPLEELWNLVQETQMPPPYLAGRLHDLGLSQDSLISIAMGDKKRNIHGHPYYQNDWVFWVNPPFEVRQEAGINNLFTRAVYDRWLNGFESITKSAAVNYETHIGIHSDRWLDIYETTLKGFILCEDLSPSFMLARLRFKKVASVDDFFDGGFPMTVILPHIIDLRIKN